MQFYTTGTVTPADLIEEEAYVTDDNRVVLATDLFTKDVTADDNQISLSNASFKKVQLGNGKAIVFNMKVHPRAKPLR